MGIAYIAFGVGNLMAYWWDDDATLAGAMLAAAGLVLGALAAGGLVVRRRRHRMGSVGVAVAALPSCAAVMFYWFPPAVLAGVLAIAVVVFALADAGGLRWTASSRSTTA